jgi:hypothetical protein
VIDFSLIEIVGLPVDMGNLGAIVEKYDDFVIFDEFQNRYGLERISALVFHGIVQ